MPVLPCGRIAGSDSLHARGIEIGGCGEETIRLRPPLVFKPKHAAVFLSILDEALADA